MSGEKGVGDSVAIEDLKAMDVSLACNGRKIQARSY